MKNPIYEITKNEIRPKIIVLLKIFQRLNVTQLSKYLRASKATVSRHLRDLTDLHIVDFSSKESTIKGRYDQKIYFLHTDLQISDNSDDQIPSDPDQFRRYCMQLLNSYKITNMIFIEMINSIQPVFSELQENCSKVDQSRLLLQNYLSSEGGLDMGLYFLTKQQFLHFQNLKKEFKEKFFQLLDDPSYKNGPYEYFIYDGNMPIMKYLELNKDQLKRRE